MKAFYSNRVFQDLAEDCEKKSKGALTIFHYQGANIVINSNDLGKLKQLFDLLNLSLSDSIKKCDKFNLSLLSSELEHIKCQLELSFNRIIEL